MRKVNKFRVWDKNIPKFNEAIDGSEPSGEMLNWEYISDSSYLIDAINGKYPLMQFINRFDINGKEVFEGDIFKQEVLMVPDGGNRHNNGTYWITCVCVVVFDADESKFCGKYEFTRLNKKSSDIDYSKFTNRRGFVALDSKIEVIGNIYENEDLLK